MNLLFVAAAWLTTGFMLGYVIRDAGPLGAWLRWNLRCLRGRRCIHAEPFEAAIRNQDGDLPDELPPGLPALVLAYECPVCGTPYRRSAMLTSVDGNFVVSDPERT